MFSVSKLRLPLKHDIVHYIETTGPPIKQRPRRLSPEKLAVLRKELSQLEQLGIIRRSSSPWGSPVRMVKKSNGSWRVVGDYRRLNQVTVKGSYSIPFLSFMTLPKIYPVSQYFPASICLNHVTKFIFTQNIFQNRNLHSGRKLGIFKDVYGPN